MKFYSSFPISFKKVTIQNRFTSVRMFLFVMECLKEYLKELINVGTYMSLVYLDTGLKVNYSLVLFETRVTYFTFYMFEALELRL